MTPDDIDTPPDDAPAPPGDAPAPPGDVAPRDCPRDCPRCGKSAVLLAGIAKGWKPVEVINLAKAFDGK